MKNKLFLVMTLYSLSLLAQNPQLTLAEALTRGLARSDLKSILEGRSALADSDIVMLRTWDNPELSVASEHIKEAGLSTRENELLLSQRIELFGVQRLKTQAAQHHRNAVLLENKSQLLDIEALIKEGFFEVLFYQERLKVLAAWNLEVQKITEIIALREKAGQASGYDRRRLLRELSESRAMLARGRAFHAASWEQLGSLLGLDGSYTVTGMLLPASDEGLPSSDGLSLAQHPKLLAYDEKIKAAALQVKAAQHWVLPEITLEAGLKTISVAGENDSGILLSAKLPLPVFNRKKSSLMQARAKGRVARGEKAWAQSKAEGEVRALGKQILLLRASVGPFRKEAKETSQDLVRIARQSYQAGELDILALLDAYRSSRDADLKVLAMEFETRGLMIELERLGGEQ